MNDVPDNDSKSISRSQRAELLERVASSVELCRAARLRELLHYLGQRSLENEHAQISESEIGIHVFGRAEDYDTSVDNIVRVNASELRKRIAAYYASEGSQETILLEIPRRHYTPQFHLRPVKPEPAADLSDTGQPEAGAVPSISSAKKWALVLSVLALFGALSGTCIYLFQQNRQLHKQVYGWMTEPALNSFWFGMLESSRQTDVVIADTSFSLVEDILKTHISLNDYLNRNYVQQIQSSSLGPELKADLQIIASRSNASLGDVRVAQKILTFDPLSHQVHLQFARDYRPGSIKNDNVILIGSSRSNPWSTLFEDRLNFVIDYDPGLSEMLVRNRHPQPGESSVYALPVDPNATSGYSVIDYIPNESHTADVLIVAGTTSEATEAAGDFLTSENSLQHLQDLLHVRKLPYFEVLLKTTKLAGTPLSAEVIAYRTFRDLPVYMK
jgi:hypothetical protein